MDGIDKFEDPMESASARNNCMKFGSQNKHVWIFVGTLPKTNIASEKWWLGNYIPFWEGQFLGAMSILRRVIDDPRIFESPISWVFVVSACKTNTEFPFKLNA